MLVRSGDLKRKEILNIRDGSRIGYPDHLLVDLDEAAVKGLVVCGRLRCFGLFGRQADLVIAWDDIELIGEDTILVKLPALPEKTEMHCRNRPFPHFFRSDIYKRHHIGKFFE